MLDVVCCMVYVLGCKAREQLISGHKKKGTKSWIWFPMRLRILFLSNIVLSTIVFKNFTKPFASEEDAALHCSKRHGETFCDLFILVTSHMERKRFSIICRETCEDFRDFVYSIGTIRSIQA